MSERKKGALALAREEIERLECHIGWHRGEFLALAQENKRLEHELRRKSRELKEQTSAVDCLRNALKCAAVAGKVIAVEEIRKAKAQFFSRLMWPGTAYAEVAV